MDAPDHHRMRLHKLSWLTLSLILLCGLLQAQAPANRTQQLAVAGLRSLAAQGQVNAVQVDSAGNLYLLLDHGDGIRVLKTDPATTTVLAEVRLGATGDSGAAMALDAAGNVYLTGTSASGALATTAGAAFPTATDSSTQSFVARLGPNLEPGFVTYTGGSRIAAAAIAATQDSVFVTGITYAANLPVTSAGIQQSPAPGSAQNGFVERFTADGTALLYASYLTGAAGDTTPTAIVADAGGSAWIAGSTTASGLPTVNALVPSMLSSPSGFLTRLTPAGDGIVFSTFVPGSGLTSLALEGADLLASGHIDLGQFPIDVAATPIVPTAYQVLLRLALDGSSVGHATLLAPGTDSRVAAVPGAAWVSGTLTAPLLVPTPIATLGSGFAARVTAAGAVDQTARFGGLPNGNPSFASLPASIRAIAMDTAGAPVLAGSVQPTASASLLATQTYDLPLRNAPTPALPSHLRDAALTSATCNGSLCAGSAAYLARLDPTHSGPALAFSADDAPLLVLRNLGSDAATGLLLAAASGGLATNCSDKLAPGAECDLLLSGGSATMVTATCANGSPQTVDVPAYKAPSSTLAFYPKELDFGVAASSSSPVTGVVTVSNLGTSSQTFTSVLDSSSRSASPFAEAATDCTLAGTGLRVLAPGASCHITLELRASASSASDGLLASQWSIGGRDVLLTGFSSAAAEAVSSTHIDFGTQYFNGLRLPRYLHLSNYSAGSLPHQALTTPAGSPFTLLDECPTSLAPRSVCRIRVDYLAATSTSNDSVQLSVDGLKVLVTGQTLPPKSLTGSSANPNLAVTPTTLAFDTPVVVTGVSATRTVKITNTGASTLPLSLALSGDFTTTTSCTQTLPAGQSCAVAVTFAPTAVGARQGLLAVGAGGGTSPAYVALSGMGADLFASGNGPADFGSTIVGQPVVQYVKLGPTFSQLAATLTGPYTVALVEDTGFGHGQPPASAFAAALQSACHNCYLALRFLPTATGAQPGTLALSSTLGGGTYTVPLAGRGTAASGLVLTPDSIDLGSVAVASSSGGTLLTLTNLTAAGQAVTLTAPVLTGDYLLDPTVAQPCTGTLAYAASCQLLVAFAPTATGSRPGKITIATGSEIVSATLAGIGTDNPGIALNPTSLAFRAVPGPSASVQTVTVTNTGATAVLVGTPATGTTAFHSESTCATLAPAARCTLTVTFQPGDAPVADLLTLPITTVSAGGIRATTAYTIALAGAYTSTAAGLAITPAAAAYGPAPTAGLGSSRQFTVTNLTARTLALTVEVPRQFVLAQPPCSSLAPAAACTFTLAALPLTHGDITGTLTARGTPSDGSAPVSGLAFVTAYGLGQGSLALAGGLIVNHAFDFGQVDSGQRLAHSFTVTNTASNAVTIRRISSQPPFLASSTCAVSLPPAGSCDVTVTYSPSNQVGSGTASPASELGVLTIESDAASSPDTLYLEGSTAAAGSPASGVTVASYSVSQGSLSFPSTRVGDVSAAQAITFTNTGTTVLHLLSFTAPADFSVQSGCDTLAPATACTVAVSSTPQTTGTHIAALEVVSDSSTALDFVSLFSSGEPGSLSLTPASLDFGDLPVSTTATLPVQVTNTGSQPVAFAALTASGDYLARGTFPAPGATLAAGAGCTVEVSFTPAAAGTRPGTLALTTSASTLPLAVALTGVGTQANLQASPAGLAFGNQPVGTRSSLTLTLSNRGTAFATGLALAATGDYNVSLPCALSTLVPGASCSVQVTFAPAASGSRPGTLTVTSSAPTLTIPLTGNGVPSGDFTLSASPTTATVASGQPATYRLALTPLVGFNAAVALTCTPITAPQYASCSLTPAQLSLAGSPQAAVVTIQTLTSLGGNARLEFGSPRFVPAFFCLLVPGTWAIWRNRRRLRRRIPLLAALCLTAIGLLTMGCGSGADPNLRFAATGSYQYRITASSTSGVPASRSVTLDLTITPR